MVFNLVSFLFLRVVNLFPLWVAPNLITVIGLAINIGTAAVLILTCPTATERPPWWATLMCALGLFLYQTLGKPDSSSIRRWVSRTSICCLS